MDRNRPPLPQAGSVHIVGQSKFIERVTFKLAGFKFHPPTRMDHGYVMMVVMMSGASEAMLRTIEAFQEPGHPPAMAYLAEDCDIGAKHELVMVGVEEGKLAFYVAKSEEDDPSKKN